MNLSFIFPQSLGQARRFLATEVLSAAAKQQGHQIVESQKADFVVLFDEHIPAQAAGKQGAVLDLNTAFANPEQALKQAVENPQTFANATTRNVLSASAQKIL